MKKIIPLLLLLACSNKEEAETASSPKLDDIKEKKEVRIYEGIIQMEDGDFPIMLSLEQGTAGLEAGFRMTVSDDPSQRHTFGKHIFGKYTILYDQTTAESKLHLHGQVMSMIKSGKKGKAPFKPTMEDVDLYFTSEGLNKLVLTDDDFDRVEDDSKYTLYERSRLITVEGYITLGEKQNDFFELNTSEKWNVASLGVWRETKQKYDSIATEQFEGVYLKAVAYWVASDSTDEDLLVIKNIIEMSKSKAYDKKVVPVQ